MKHLIQSHTHHLASGCCIWSGIEDVYAARVQQALPEAFLMTLASFGETALVSTPKAEAPAFLSLGDGRTRKTYDSIADLLGLSYRISGGAGADYALRTAKKETDAGRPVILGPLDMFHLPYLKMYHTQHIPMHYVLMVGYEEEDACLLIYDCDRTALQRLPESELFRAWKVEQNVVGKPNGFVRFSLTESVLPPDQLAAACLRRKAERQLCEKPEFVGTSAYLRLARMLPKWQASLSESEYRNFLVSLTASFGRVPKLPNAFLGENGPDIPYQGNYDRLSALLISYGTAYHRQNWCEAGSDFVRCGKNIEAATVAIIAYAQQGIDCTDLLQRLFCENATLATHAYKLILQEGNHAV